MREFIFRMRGGIWTLLFVAVLFMVRASGTEQRYACIILVFLGQVWRCWAAGCIGLYRGENVKAKRLAENGPYALMRNPLYFGNFVIGLGWSVAAGFRGVMLFTVSFILLYVAVIIPHEEAFLREKFGIEYEEYCLRVKRFWPLVIDVKALCEGFDATIVMRSEIHTITSTIIGTIIILGVTLCYT
ncbi:MAG: isoprenylcysteine carboxylmethyltransferase family protein [Synergistaceae bacterium]|nr:isoprenylcysteine carboxylmethyltransferase family protein [Synergistaceae bacterium]